MAKVEISKHAKIRSLLNDQQQPNFKLLGYLFAAHAGGMIACLSVLKDYKDNLQLKGIGIFVALFGFGLIVTALAFVLLAVAIECAYRWIVRDQPKIEPDWLVRDFTASTFEHVGRVCTKLTVIFLYASALSFIVAIAIGIYRFGGL